MNAMLILFGGTLGFLVLFAVFLGVMHPRSGNDIVGRSLRNIGAEAEIEENDIEEMLEARNQLRQRIGKPPLGDELAKQLEPHLRDG